MLEVLERFPAIGMIQPGLTPIENYQALPPGERELYEQYTLIKWETEAKTPALKFNITGKGG